METATLNVWLAWAVVLLAIATFDSMNGTTGWPVRLALLAIFGAMIGQGLGPLLDKWGFYLDTLLFAGVAAFLLACRRNPIGIKPPWNERLSVAVSVAAALYVVIVFPWDEATQHWMEYIK
jgi:hypothetical protein